MACATGNSRTIAQLVLDGKKDMNAAMLESVLSVPSTSVPATRASLVASARFHVSEFLSRMPRIQGLMALLSYHSCSRQECCHDQWP